MVVKDEGMQAKSIWKQDPVVNIWDQKDENGGWRRLHNEEIHILYQSLDIVSIIKFRRLRKAGHLTRVEEGRSTLKILTGKPTVN